MCGWDAVHQAVDRVEDFSSNLTAILVYRDDGTVTPFDMGPPGGASDALARQVARIVLGKLLERTTWIEATDVGEWLPSVLVRRRKRLQLAVG